VLSTEPLPLIMRLSVPPDSWSNALKLKVRGVAVPEGGETAKFTMSVKGLLEAPEEVNVTVPV
jgi:hypothetical protein